MTVRIRQPLHRTKPTPCGQRMPARLDKVSFADSASDRHSVVPQPHSAGDPPLPVRFVVGFPLCSLAFAFTAPLIVPRIVLRVVAVVRWSDASPTGAPLHCLDEAASESMGDQVDNAAANLGFVIVPRAPLAASNLQRETSLSAPPPLPAPAAALVTLPHEVLCKALQAIDLGRRRNSSRSTRMAWSCGSFIQVNRAAFVNAGHAQPNRVTRNSHATPAKPLRCGAAFAYFCLAKPLESFRLLDLAKVGVEGSNPFARSKMPEFSTSRTRALGVASAGLGTHALGSQALGSASAARLHEVSDAARLVPVDRSAA